MTINKKYCYDFPRPALTVDGIILGKTDSEINVLLIERKYEPFKNHWALPGGFVDEYESVEDAVQREIMEETNLDGLHFKQLYTFSRKGRDPRGWTVSVAFYTIVNINAMNPKAADDAENLSWFPLDRLPSLAFDHQEVLNYCINNKLIIEELSDVKII